MKYGDVKTQNHDCSVFYLINLRIHRIFCPTSRRSSLATMTAEPDHRHRLLKISQKHFMALWGQCADHRIAHAAYRAAPIRKMN
jgi:hypothetical protein